MIAIYILINSLTGGVFYVGVSLYPGTRHQQHLLESKKLKSKKDIYIQSVLNQNGCVDMEIIDYCPFYFSPFWEQHYMDLYRSWGYVLLQTARPSCNLMSGFRTIEGLNNVRVQRSEKDRYFKEAHEAYYSAQSGSHVCYNHYVTQPQP